MEEESLDVRLLRFRGGPAVKEASSLALELLEAARAEEAVEVCARGLAIDPDAIALRVLQGRIWLKRGDLIRAQQLLLATAQAFPEDLEAYRWLGEVLLERGDPRRALRVLERAEIIDPNDSNIAALKEQAANLVDASGLLHSKAPGLPTPAMLRAPVVHLVSEEEEEPEESTSEIDPSTLNQLRSEIPPAPLGAASRPIAERLDPEVTLRVRAVDLPLAEGHPDEDNFDLPDEPEAVVDAEMAAAIASQETSMAATKPRSRSGGAATADVGPAPDVGSAPDVGPAPNGGPRRQETRTASPQSGRLSSTAGAQPSSDPRPAGRKRRARGRVLRLFVVFMLAAAVLVGGWLLVERGLRQGPLHTSPRLKELRGAVIAGDSEVGKELQALSRGQISAPLRFFGVDSDQQAALDLWVLHEVRSTLDDPKTSAKALEALLQDRGNELDDSTAALAQAAMLELKGRFTEAREAVEEIDSPNDPLALYLKGRLARRLGSRSYAADLQNALEREPRLATAAILLAARALDDGDPEGAKGWLLRIDRAAADTAAAELITLQSEGERVDPRVGFKRLQALDTRLAHAPRWARLRAETLRAAYLARSGQLDPAREVVREASQQAALASPSEALGLTEVARRVGLLRVAETIATKALARAPDERRLHRSVAEARIARGDGRGTLEALRELADDEPSSTTLLARAALITGAEEDRKRAIIALESAEKPELVEQALVIRLRSAAGQDMMREALALRAEHLEKAAIGARGEIVRAVADAALALGQPEVAVEALTRRLADTPKEIDSLLLLGLALHRIGDTEPAAKSYERVVEVSPDHLIARLSLGSLQLLRGRPAEAETIFRSLLDDPAGDSADARLGLAEAFAAQGRLVEAQQELQKVPEAQRRALSLTLALAQTLLEAGRAPAASALLESLTRADDVPPDALALQGDILLALKNVEEARVHYGRALDKDATNLRALFGSADLMLRAERRNETTALLRRAETALRGVDSPEHLARLRYLQGRLAYEAGDRAEARQLLRKATAQRGAPPEAWFWLGESLAGEHSPNARAAYRRYLELEPEGLYARRAKRAIGEGR